MNGNEAPRLACLSATELNLLGEKSRVVGSVSAMSWLHHRLSQFSDRLYAACPDRSVGAFTSKHELVSRLQRHMPLVDGGDELAIVDIEAQQFLAIRLENHPEDTFTIMSGNSSLLHILRCYCYAFRLTFGTWPESVLELWSKRTLYRRSERDPMTDDFAYWQEHAIMKKSQPADRLRLELPCLWTREVQVAELGVEDRLDGLSLTFVEAAFGVPGGSRQVEDGRRRER